jgi:hypothetical protein
VSTVDQLTEITCLVRDACAMLGIIQLIEHWKHPAGKGLLAPNGRLQFVETANNAIQDITYSGWLMQPQLQGERMHLPDPLLAKTVPWVKADASMLNQPLVWYQAKFVTPSGSSALVLDAGGLGRGHAYVNGL